MGKGVEETNIDITELETSLMRRTSEENRFGAHKCCIFRTPNILSRHNKDAYVPDAFAIGPMHHGQPHLEAAEKIKSLYLADFLGRSTSSRPFSLTTVIEAVRAVEAEARACYAESLDKFKRNDLVEMLVLDGCFLIELFTRSAHPDSSHPDDPIRTMACMGQFLSHDLVLLENQIPWLVLQALFTQTIGLTPGQSTLKTRVIRFFSHHFSTVNSLHEPASDECKHILDLIRSSLISTFNIATKQEKWMRIPSAVELTEAGVTLVNKQTGKERTVVTSIFNLEFKPGGRLEIPHLLVQETTEATFRNLICYEQCYPKCEPVVTSYAILMDNLIDSSRDLEKLCKEGIVDNWLDPEEATKMFNNLYNDANVKEFYYIELCQEVELYCKRLIPRWRAGYVHNYFSTPWAIVSQVVGTVVLVLTILQTCYTIRPA